MVFPPSVHYLFQYLNPITSLNHFLNAHRFREIVKKYGEISKQDLKPLFFIFTCDTELTPPFRSGSWRNRSSAKLGEALLRLLEILEQYSIKGTFYVEGVLCEVLPSLVRDVWRQGHEIGCHGYNHESYGGFWRTSETVEQPVILKLEERREKIALAVKTIEKVVGRKPTSFKAPFDVIDGATLSILEDTGFEVDSSLRNFVYGKFSFPYHPNKNRIDQVGNMRIFELPFTVSPFPRRRWLYSYRFDPLSKLYLHDVQQALSVINFLRKLHTCLKFPSSVIMLTSHPWDFSTAGGLIGEVHAEQRLNSLSYLLEALITGEDAKSNTLGGFLKDWQNLKGGE